MVLANPTNVEHAKQSLAQIYKGSLHMVPVAYPLIKSYSYIARGLRDC